MTNTQNRGLEAKGRAVLERIFGAERAAEIIAASPVPLGEAWPPSLTTSRWPSGSRPPTGSRCALAGAGGSASGGFGPRDGDRLRTGARGEDSAACAPPPEPHPGGRLPRGMRRRLHPKPRAPSLSGGRDEHHTHPNAAQRAHGSPRNGRRSPGTPGAGSWAASTAAAPQAAWRMDTESDRTRRL
jgi:hypothetical protein